jgi:NADPH:quinone reductase-like Zn-dependent oxidoreductase
VSKWKAGDKVVTLFNQGHQAGAIDVAASKTGLGGCIDGTLAQYGVFDQTGVVRMPANLDFVEAATLTCAALTSWNALYGLRRLRKGETVLVQGTGGVSLFALQVCLPVLPSFSCYFLTETVRQSRRRDRHRDHVVGRKDRGSQEARR